MKGLPDFSLPAGLSPSSLSCPLLISAVIPPLPSHPVHYAFVSSFSTQQTLAENLGHDGSEESSQEAAPSMGS